MLDTDVVIAALDRGDAHHREAAKAIAGMLEDDDQLLLSTINYAEALVRPAEESRTLQVAVDAIAALGIRPVAPTAAIARDAARIRSLGVSLADGFALATAQASSATIASFDRRVRRAMAELGLDGPRRLR
ncbi:MAG TPA: PIN domain-containing protein [Solirubrobacterales bacterium]|nr:PIN domain-containing protein [Solirubrobacterales bacterium]